MKRSRRKTCNDTLEDAFPFEKDYVRELSDALQCHDDLLVLDPQSCICPHATAENAHRDAAQALSLIVVNTGSAAQSTTSSGHPPRTTLRGLGIIDYTVSPLSLASVERTRWVVVFHVAPVCILAVPWVPQLPLRLQALVYEDGRLASLGESNFGAADVGPVPEGYVIREVVALVRGLPRCRVEAVSGCFPLFRAPRSTEVINGGVESAETMWEVRHAGDADVSNARDGLMQRHLERLAPLQNERLLAAVGTARYGESLVSTKMWVVVSYPDGLPQLQTTQYDGNLGSPPTHKRHKNAKASAATAVNSVVDTSAAKGSDAAPSVSPLFLLPAETLCQHLSIQAGWQRIAREHRETASNAVQRLRDIIEVVSLRACDGTAVSVNVAVDPPDRGTKGGPSVTLAKASALQL